MPKDELIGRLEKADGPDRELDEALHEAFGLTFVMEYYTEYATEQTRNLSYVPAYTASIDAALTLVPEGCGFVVMGKAAKIGRKIATAATPALAICIAALRAKGDE